MKRKLLIFLGVLAALVAVPAQAQVARTPPAPPAVVVVPTPKPPAPALKAGMQVVDREGSLVGSIEAMTEAPMGLMAVIKMDGKMVAIPADTLRIHGERAQSTQSKDEMLLAAGAPEPGLRPIVAR